MKHSLPKSQYRISWWEKTKLSFLMSRIINNPQNTAAVFKYFEVSLRISDQDLVELHVNRMYQKNPIEEDFKNEYSCLEKLRSIPQTSFPKGSFGEAVQQHYSDHGLDVEFYPTLFEKDKNRKTYMIQRSYEMHDLWHPLLGLGIESMDEMAVLAFTAGQLSSPSSMDIAFAAYMSSIQRNPEWDIRLIDFMMTAYKTGCGAPPLLCERIEDKFFEPLGELRESLHIPAEGLVVPELVT